jgi:cyclopropane fatty-acyl-phospholipid synthase-like methyltransferase
MASDTLANAQITKLAHLGINLCIQPNQKVLDIGTKWGGAGAFDRGSS